MLEDQGRKQPMPLGKGAVEICIKETAKRLMPAFFRIQRFGRAMALLVLLIALPLQLHMLLLPGDPAILVRLFPICFGIILVFALDRYVARRKQKLILPELARSLALEYEHRPADFIRDIPARLLPRGRRRRGEDLVQGKVADREVTMAEVSIETGGRRSRRLFKGFVVRFKNIAEVPTFFIVDEAETRGLSMLLERIKVSDLTQAERRLSPSGLFYGVWLSEEDIVEANPALGSVIDTLLNLETAVSANARLFSATSTGQEMHVAFSYTRDLYRIGGLLADEDRIIESIARALDDLQLPIKVAKALLEAERKTLELRQQLA